MTTLWKALRLFEMQQSLDKEVFRVTKLRRSLRPEHKHELSASRHRLPTTPTHFTHLFISLCLNKSLAQLRAAQEPPQITIIQPLQYPIYGKWGNDEYANSFKYRGTLYIYIKKNVWCFHTNPSESLEMKRTSFIIPAPSPPWPTAKPRWLLETMKKREHCSAVKNASHTERENIWRVKIWFMPEWQRSDFFFFFFPFRRSYRWGFGGRELRRSKGLVIPAHQSGSDL